MHENKIKKFLAYMNVFKVYLENFSKVHPPRCMSEEIIKYSPI
jgi:hypothetical protein